MLQHAVALLLQRLLGKFVTFDSNMLTMSLWQGDLSFQDLQLRLPFGEGSIGLLQVKIPWRALWTQSVSIRAEGIRIFLHQSAKQTSIHEEVQEKVVESETNDDRTYLSKLVSHIIANVQIELSDIQIRYCCVLDSTIQLLSTSRKARGNATLQVGRITLVNADSNWEFDDSPQSSTGMESRKLIKANDIYAYVDYDDEEMTEEPTKYYIIHDWDTVLQVTLSYNSANAAFPDVGVNVILESTKNTSLEECAFCHRCDTWPDKDDDKLALATRPRIHIGSEHIDILCAILLEVKAPYDEYDRLAQFTKTQNSSSEGFLMVLSYAKQWLLSDCITGNTNEAISYNSDDDDDDEFEDAITPPSLTVHVGSSMGVDIDVVSRRNEQIGEQRLWLWRFGKWKLNVKQTCIEDDIDVVVHSLRIIECTQLGQNYTILYDVNSNQAIKQTNMFTDTEGTPLLHFSWTSPSLQGRLIGETPNIQFSIEKKCILSFYEDSIVAWLSLHRPIWLWWKKWNSSHPNKVDPVEQTQIVVSNWSVSIQQTWFFCGIREQLIFGLSLGDISTATVNNDRLMEKNFAIQRIQFMSTKLDLATIQNHAVNETYARFTNLIVDITNILFKQIVRAKLSLESSDIPSYAISHTSIEQNVSKLWENLEGNLANPPAELQIPANSQYTIVIPEIRIKWTILELQEFLWIIGKWSFFVSSDVQPYQAQIPNLRKGDMSNSVCQQSILLRIDTIEVTISDEEKSLTVQLSQVDYALQKFAESHQISLTVGKLLSEYESMKIIEINNSEGVRRSASFAVKLAASSSCVRAMPMNKKSKDLIPTPQQLHMATVHFGEIKFSLYLPLFDCLLSWYLNSYNSYLSGNILSTSYGYTFQEFEGNLVTISRSVRAQNQADTNITKFKAEFTAVAVLDIYHDKSLDGKLIATKIASANYNNASLCFSKNIFGSGKAKLEGELHDFFVLDCCNSPQHNGATEQSKVHEYFITSNESVELDNREFVQFGAKNSVDFILSWNDTCQTHMMRKHSLETPKNSEPLLTIRLDSVCIVYLHRIFKQYLHYVNDNILKVFDMRIQAEEELIHQNFNKYGVNLSQLPVSLEEVTKMFKRAVSVKQPDAFGDLNKDKLQASFSGLKVKLLANDLVFIIPRSSFSPQSLVLHCTNGRLWSRGFVSSDLDTVDIEIPANESYNSRYSNSSASALEVNAAKFHQIYRKELRNLRRLVRNQRSRIMNAKSQVYNDLKNATQHAHNYLHEGFAALPEAENTVSTLRSKIIMHDKELEELNEYLKEVEQKITAASNITDVTSDPSRGNMDFTLPSPTSQSPNSGMQSMERIKHAVAAMSKHLTGQLFGADDSEFYDAITFFEDSVSLPSPDPEEDGSLKIFEFELVDLSVTASNSSTFICRHALVGGAISQAQVDSETPISDTSLWDISFMSNELNLGISPAEYNALLGLIFENFKEVSPVVDEDTYELCSICNGHHTSADFCRTTWIQIPVRVMDLAVRVSDSEKFLADFFFERLILKFVLKTDDSMEISASASTVSAIDIRPNRCPSTVDFFRPTSGTSPQIEYLQTSTWTDSSYSVKVKSSHCLIIYPLIEDLARFFIKPVVYGNFASFGDGFITGINPEWKKMEVSTIFTDCWVSLFSDFNTKDAHGLVIRNNIELSYFICQNCDDSLDMKKLHFNFDQLGLYFSRLPEFQIDVAFPLSNVFSFTFDHVIESTNRLNRRNSFVLSPIEARFSVQDGNLFIAILRNYTKRFAAMQQDSASTNEIGVMQNATFPNASSLPRVPIKPTGKNIYGVDKLLGDVGELRLVLVNNSLGVPIVDFLASEIVCEYIQDEDCSTNFGVILSLNYFNNRIYRWEPLVEPFVLRIRADRTLDENSRTELFVNLPSTVNVNATPEMAPLLSYSTFKQADFVTTGSKSTAPFWIQNKTGMEIRISFRRGRGHLIQETVLHNNTVAIDCREKGEMRTFDSTQTDKFLQSNENLALTANHTLSVWLNNNAWVSVNPVVVDIVGHISIPLREVENLHQPSFNDTQEIREELPPVLVAEISIQSDGSKLISLHSQVIMQNRTSVPLMVWTFCPRGGGMVEEWTIDREEVCYVPLKLIHPQSKISIRPSPTVQFSPLATSLDELNDDINALKSCNTKRFVRSGNCVCNFESFSSTSETDLVGSSQFSRFLSAYDANTMRDSSYPLSGFVIHDMPTWKCTYDVDAYYLMRAAFSVSDDWQNESEIFGMTATKELKHIPEEGEKDVEDAFRGVFSSANGQKHPRRHALNDVAFELEEARASNIQRRGLFEATESSLYHISISPFLTIHNRLPTAVAYRLLNQSLQLIGEGILSTGIILPLFQIDPHSLLYISFRMENYLWSAPKLIINMKDSMYTIPYKESIHAVEMCGRVFDRKVTLEQSTVPNVQLQVKLLGRDVVVFCSVWIVNHSNLDLEYCSSSSSSSKKLDANVKYVHRLCESDESEINLASTFLEQPPSANELGDRKLERSQSNIQLLSRFEKVQSAVLPVALIVVVREAEDLYNAQYFGSQCPYVKASLYMMKDPNESYSTGSPHIQEICSATTRPCPSGGQAPKWDDRSQNTLMLRIPEDLRGIERVRVMLEVRNIRFGMDTCLGVAAVKLENILRDPTYAAAFNWYKLLKRNKSKSSKSSSNDFPSMQRGRLCVSFSVGTKQLLRTLDHDNQENSRSPMASFSPISNEADSALSPIVGSGVDDLTIGGIQSPKSEILDFLPSSRSVRMSRRHSPGKVGYFFPSSSVASRSSTFWPPEDPLNASTTKESFENPPNNSTAMRRSVSDQLSTRVSRTGRKLYPIRVYLPQNRFLHVIVEVSGSTLMSEVFDLVTKKIGLQQLLDINEVEFFELILPRFISLRSAGRPEGDRWYGQQISMDSKINKRGRQHGLHLCHKITITTIRLYDDKSTASSHHLTPRSISVRSSSLNPTQHKPMPWGDILVYGPGGKNWDVLRIRSQSSSWSDVVRLNRNAMGNSGVAQVITLNNEAYEHDKDSELRTGSQEVALWCCYGTGRFSDTIIATLVPRFILINRCGFTIQYRQFNTQSEFSLSPNDIVPFHWPSASKDRLLEITMMSGYTWSGSFRIYSIGTTYLKLRRTENRSQIYILQCHIELVGGSITLVFRPESKRFPPYRIDNMTSFRLQYKQANWGDHSDYDELLPRTSCPYSWDYLRSEKSNSSTSNLSADSSFLQTSSTIFPRYLEIRYMRVSKANLTGKDVGKDTLESREYNIDEMTTHRKILLHRSLPADLFLNPDMEGFLRKKDNLVSWTDRYFRLHDRVLYYFATQHDQHLLGVIDLRSTDFHDAPKLVVSEKSTDTASKGGFMSMLTGTLFGGAQETDELEETQIGNRMHFLAQLAVGMSASTNLQNKSIAFATDYKRHGQMKQIIKPRKGFFVSGNDIIEYIMAEQVQEGNKVSQKEGKKIQSRDAVLMAQEMLNLKIITPLSPGFGTDTKAESAIIEIFKETENVWYMVNSVEFGDETVAADDENKKYSGTTNFAIHTGSKSYELKAKDTETAGEWVRLIRQALNTKVSDDDNSVDLNNKANRQQKDTTIGVHNTKTFVHIRVRADGPTKVLELYEGGEEDQDEKDIKYELSSQASNISTSPTQSETSTNNPFDTMMGGLSLHLFATGFGVSCVNEVPMELVYAYIGGINVRYTRRLSKMKLSVTFDDIQVDNQCRDATFEKLICQRRRGEVLSKPQNNVELVKDVDVFESLNNVQVIQSPRESGLVANTNLFSCADCKYRQRSIAAMHFCTAWSNEQGTTDYFEHCSFWLYPVTVQLDEELLGSARSFFSSMAQSRGQHASRKRGGDILLKNSLVQSMLECLDEFHDTTSTEELDPIRNLLTASTATSAEVRKVYFAFLHIHPFEFDITFRSDVIQVATTIRQEAIRASQLSREGSTMSVTTHGSDELKRSTSNANRGEPESESSQNSGTWAIPSLIMHVPDLDNAPVRLNALLIEHAFGTSGELMRRVSKYYTRQLWRQFHKVIGSFDFLGNPVGFLDHIGTGVRDFVYEPLDGLRVGGKGFSRGLAKGTASLVSNTLDGTFDAASKISGTVGQGLATFSFDDHYQQVRARARRRHVRGIKDGLVQGTKELSLGVYEGVSGVLLGPMRGAQENGAVGFVKGTVTGIIGLPMKPVAGLFDFASRATQGVRNRAYHGSQSMKRVRRPRVFGRYNELKCYKEADTVAYYLLQKAGGERLVNEKIIFYNEVIQIVSASYLTNEARKRKTNDSLKERTNSLRKSIEKNHAIKATATSTPKINYQVLFHKKKLGLNLETDFYGENVSIKSVDEDARLHIMVQTPLPPDYEVLEPGDLLVCVGGVDVRGIGFNETLSLLRGTSRPILLEFESAEERSEDFVSTVSASPNSTDLKVQLNHWLIVTEQRALYINVSSMANPIVEWMTPLRYIFRVERKINESIVLHLSVGVDSLPAGPRTRPSFKAIDAHQRDMEIFLDVMWHSFGSSTAEEQELWPSDTSLNGFLLKKGGFTTVRRWFVLCRNCLYYFTNRKVLRGIIPLGNVRLEKDPRISLSIRISNVSVKQPLLSLVIDGGQVIERVQSDIVLVCPTIEEWEMWQSSLAHAAGKGMRNSSGRRFYVSNESSRLEVGIKDTPDFVVAPLTEAIKKTIEVFNATAG